MMANATFSVIKACLILRVLGAGGRKLIRVCFLWMDTRILDVDQCAEDPHRWRTGNSMSTWLWRQTVPVWAKGQALPWLALTVITPEWETRWIYFLYKKKNPKDNYTIHPACIIYCGVRITDFNFNFYTIHWGNCSAESTKSEPFIQWLGTYPTEMCIYEYVHPKILSRMLLLLIMGKHWKLSQLFLIPGRIGGGVFRDGTTAMWSYMCATQYRQISPA